MCHTKNNQIIILNMTNELLKVLWVEDDPVVTRSYPTTAERHGLDLISFSCWDDAKIALQCDFYSWDAIILDAKCKPHKEDKDNAAKFLGVALSDIQTICGMNKHQINWYVLSGAGGLETQQINDLILEARMAWDADWTNTRRQYYYNKTKEEVELLFDRIKYHVSRSERTQIKTQLYKDVFDAIKYCKLNLEAEEEMIDLLQDICFPKGSVDMKGRMASLRSVAECIFRSMIKQWGILPQEFITDADREKVNLTWSKRMLEGKNVTITNTNTNTNGTTYSYPSQICNDLIKSYIKNIIELTGNFIHTGNTQLDSGCDIKQYLKQVNNSSYLVKSLTFGLCDVLLWFKSYIMANPDPTVNRTKWTIINNTSTPSSSLNQ